MLSSASTSELRLRVPSDHLMLDLLGEQDEFLRRVEKAFPEAKIVARGNEFHLSGPEDEAGAAHTVLSELLLVVQEGQRLDGDQVDRVVQMVRDDVPSPSGVFSSGIPVGGGRVIRPKTLGQRRYIDTIRANTVSFGIGPAGTGKTYLAMATAVEALRSGATRRILLTRPAVEAGERELRLFDKELAGDVDLDRYLPATDRVDFEDDYEIVAFDEELQRRGRGAR